MLKDQNINDFNEWLRKRAESLVPDKSLDSIDLDKLSPNELRHIVHELHVHQIELQMQNEEMRQAQTELSRSKQRFLDLYQLAPISYVIINHKGFIKQANVSFCDLVHKDQKKIENRPIFSFIHPTAQADFISWFQNLAKQKRPEGKDFPLIRDKESIDNEQEIWAHIRGVWIHDRAEKEDEDHQSILISLLDISERIAAQRELEITLSRLNHAIEVGNLAWWQMEIPTGKIFFHEKKTLMLNYNPENFKGKTYHAFTDLIHPDDYEKAMNAMRDHITGKKDAYETEYRIKSADGTWRWFYDFGKITQWTAQNQPLTVTGIVVDVTERKKYEIALSLSERKFRALFEKSTDGIVVIDADTMRFAYANDRWLSMTGYDKKDLETLSLEKIHLENDIEKNKHYFSQILNGQLDRIVDVVVKRKDGSTFIAEISAYRLSLDNQTQVVGIFRDVQKQREAEEKLQASEERFRRIFEDSAIGMVLCHLDGSFAQVNQTFSNITGYEQSELLKMSFQDITSPEDLSMNLQAANELIDRKRPSYQIEKRYVHKNGSIIWVMLTVSMLYEMDQPKYFAGQIQDITELKETTKKLQIALDAANAATKAKSEFLANMSHEIRTPMNGVLGMLHLLRESSLNLEQKNFVQLALNSGESLLTIINDILDFSKIESGKLKIESILFDLHQLAIEVYSILKFQADEKRLKFELHYDIPHNHAFYGDPTRIRQILFNLLGNAIKFTEIGSVSLKINLNADNNVIIQVADTGIGIPENQLENIFRLFEQADTSTTRRFGGTGLGLSISKHLAELMGGKILVTSKLGKGSTFSLDLPLQSEQFQFSYNGFPAADHKIKLFIVDDNNLFRTIFHSDINKDFLKNLEIFFISNFFDLEDFLDQQTKNEIKDADNNYNYLIIIPQYSLSKNISEFTSKIRSKPKLANVKFILLSEQSYFGHDKEMEAVGFNGYLSRPYTLGQFWQMVCEIIHQNDPISDSLKTSSTDKIITKYHLPEKSLTDKLMQEIDENSLEFKLAIPKNILLVEDNPVNQIISKKILEKFNLIIEIANNGEEAVERVQAKDYDLVFMDLQMPVLDGYDATSKIRTLSKKHKDLPIIAMTAGVLYKEKERALQAGLNDFTEKPIDLKEIKRVLQTWLH